MGRKHRRNVPPKEAKKWCRTEKGWELMSKDKEEKTMLVCDEAYLLIDPNVLQAIVFLRNVSKRCRKYECSLVIISHSIVKIKKARS